MNNREFKVFTITKAIIIILLLIGMCNMAYGYYQIMKLAVTALFAFIAWYEWNEEHYLIGILCCLSAIVYQPFQKLAFKKNEWHQVDSIFIGLLFLWILIDIIIALKKPKIKSE